MTERARRVAEVLVEPREPPRADAHVDRAIWGAAQPLVGARLLFRSPALRRAALLPVVALAVLCAVVALLSPSGPAPLGILKRFYQTFAFLAPLPSLFFAAHYARLAAEAHAAFGFAPVQPCIEPFSRALGRTIAQAILIAIAIFPATLALRLLPLLGWLLVRAVAGLWALHWIVVDAFDGARVLPPGATLKEVDEAAARAPSPWFVRALLRVPVLGAFAKFCDRLARPWREEIAVLEHHPSLAAGFAIATAVLLATPVLNLLFRPIVIVGAVHVMGRLANQPSSTARTLPVSVSAENGFCKNAAP